MSSIKDGLNGEPENREKSRGIENDNVMNLGVVFKDFCNELEKRKGFLSEDNIRFYWFASMLKQDPILNNYSLEEPYPLGKEELDLKYEEGFEEDGSEEGCSEIFVFEIKFHRHQEGKSKELPTTESAGKIFNDLIRLPSWKPKTETCKPIRYFFLYVTDNVMNEHLSGSKLLSKFYDSKVGSSFKGSFTCENCGGDSPKTFFRNACKSLGKTCSKFKSRTNVCAKLCTKTEGPISTPDIKLIDKVDALRCDSGELKTRKCWVRLYEVI